MCLREERQPHDRSSFPLEFFLFPHPECKTVRIHLVLFKERHTHTLYVERKACLPHAVELVSGTQNY